MLLHKNPGYAYENIQLVSVNYSHLSSLAIIVVFANVVDSD